MDDTAYNIPNAPMKNAKNRRVGLKIALGIAALLLVLVAFSAFYEVYENQYACVMRFGSLVAMQDQPGLYFKTPFIDEVKYVSKALTLYDVPKSETLTADKKAMVTDLYCLYYIEDPKQFLQTVGYTTEVQKRIDAAAYSAMKNLMGTMMQEKVIRGDTDDSGVADGRSLVNRMLTETVNGNMTGYGVRIVAVEIKRFDLPEDNAAAVYQRMIAERQQMAETYRADGNKESAFIRNQADKDSQIIIAQAKNYAEKTNGEGERLYMEILADAYNTPESIEFYTFLRQLEAMKNSLKGQKTVILSKDSPIAKALMGE